MQRLIGTTLIVLLLTLGGWSLWSRTRPAGAPMDPTESPPRFDHPAIFADVTEESGLAVGFHQTGRFTQYFFPDIMAPGAAFLDYDRDGDLDIFLANAVDRSGGRSGPRLYRQGADGRFTDVTEQTGLRSEAYGMGVAVGDVNNDGYPDLYLTNYGADQLFVNRQDGTFADISESAGLGNPRWAASACFVDYDRDGWLDLMVTNYVDYYSSLRCEDGRGKEDYCGPQVFSGTSDRLYHNITAREMTDNTRAQTESVRFEDVSLASGIALREGPGLGVIAGDFDGDRWPDLYVANDGAANFLWSNRQNGTFQEVAVLFGVANDGLGRPQAGMGLAVGDLNDDARFDLLVTHLDGETNALYLSENGGFIDAGGALGLSGPSLPRTGFGTALCDLDHDGDLDAIVVNGRVKRSAVAKVMPSDDPSSAKFWSSFAEANQIFLNDDGHFIEYLADDDGFLSARDVSRGLAVGDVDRDGDLDLLVTSAGTSARLYRNVAQKAGHWLQVEAIDPRHGGRVAEGAVVSVTSGGRTWRRLVHSGSSYLSSHDPIAHFGLGQVDHIEAVEVAWPDGLIDVFAGGEADRLQTVRREDGTSGE